MLTDIKKELLQNPEKLKNVLEHFGYCNITIHQNYMQFGRDAHSSRKSIVIRLEKNDWLYLTDYPRNINMELFSYIMQERNVKFIDVLNTIKIELGISDYYTFFDSGSKGIFGGIYKNIKKKQKEEEIKILDNEILEQYVACPNYKFLQDHISIDTQKEFNIKFDIESQSIIIPIYDQLGQLMGVKARINREPKEDEQKYFYLYPCQMSRTLYGYSHNYKYLTNNTVYVFEAEKSTLQCWSYGIKNCVSLGSGTLSKKQAQMLLELNPTKIIFMHDVGFKMEYIQRNLDMMRKVSRFSDVELGYWDYFNKDYEDKISPSDLGYQKLRDIMIHEIYMIGDDHSEDEI